VSPLLRDELEVVLAPSQVSMARYAMAFTRRGLRRRLVGGASTDCPAATPGTPAWSTAVRILGEQLRGMPHARANLHIIVSSQFVRYAIIPWQADLSASEDAAYQRHHFAHLFGSSADGWDICAAAAPEGKPRLASAIDAALLLALRELCALDSIRLKAVRPQFASTFNGCRRSLPASGWLVLAESGCLCIGLFEDRRWLAIRTLRIGAGWLQDLPGLLAREACLANPAREASEVFLWAPDWAPGMALPEGRFRFHALPALQHDAARQGAGR
jgi:hypothetical protein